MAPDMHVIANEDGPITDVKTIDHSDFTLEAFGLEVLDQLLDDDVFNRGLIKGIRCKSLKKLTDFGSNDLGGVGDLEDDHEKSADGET
ncbi:hypothetical protein H8F24_10105 [Synechococcus sp. CBW1002]|nr:hypothetical protein H8F24_10105 [Synechococcus sp. CBW1002]QPN65311.1 hypothetical protein H8F26_09775 [Synechococcus sp. CBW1006]